MVRLLVIAVFLFVSCNRAKAIDLDASKTPAGLFLDSLLSNIGQSDPNLPHGNALITEFVAAGDNCALLKSDDGITWTVFQGSETPFPGCNGGVIYDLAYGNGTLVAVGTLSSHFLNRSNNCGLWTSTDSVNWTRHECPASDNKGQPNTPIRSIGFGKAGGVDTFLAAGLKLSGSQNDFTYSIISSNGGASWEYRKIPGPPTPGNAAGGEYGSCFIQFNDSAAYCTMENQTLTGIAMPLHQYVPSNGAWNVNQDGPGGYDTPLPVMPPNYNPRSFFLFSAKNSVMYSFGLFNSATTGGTVYADRKFSNGQPWNVSAEGLTFSAPGVRMNAAADTNSKLVLVGDQCNWMYSTDLTNSGQPLQNWITQTSMKDCQRTDWADLTYNSKLNRYVGVGVQSSNPPKGYITVTAGDPIGGSDWLVTSTALNGRINAVISKH
ncbi:hypothetical protein CH373_17560 [Leptospira perolatii]|nr:hypothetical protein CH373_17560 [Leptospira perolatii]